ncbi:RNA polymerase sigma-70 factor, ECF subfamily [Lishizhenia tianjinensis]|uniref:RNA polymerase sigma-70 factor, ECF subfamily n=1 Tax=Lishizhenia tianjinensis TaxID=477690 RepID=A0A1I7BNI1_9FLAO|nr:sigma-70 family RNA polymerase sigma factor [Lishizhenia tianjinensis]SFT88708.1 RNA polymerase sigma-70 factor, ECF subfamily [Lishizhenia tianjinensis]
MEKSNAAILEEWVDAYSDYLLNFALSKIKDRDLALDFLQDTYVSALKNLHTFQGKSSPKTWLVSILNRKIIDHWRQQQSRKTKPISHYGSDEDGSQDWLLETGEKHENDGESALIFDEEQMLLEDCMAKLPEQWQGIMRAKYFENKKGEEISKEFDITASNLWVIVHRAKTTLRECLGTKWF